MLQSWWRCETPDYCSDPLEREGGHFLNGILVGLLENTHDERLPQSDRPDAEDEPEPGSWPVANKTRDAQPDPTKAVPKEQAVPAAANEKSARSRVLNTGVKSNVAASQLRAPVNAQARRTMHELSVRQVVALGQGEVDVTCATLSVNRTEIAVGDATGRLWIIDADGVAPLVDPSLSRAPLAGAGGSGSAHAGSVLALSYTMHEDHLISSGIDGVVRLWKRFGGDSDEARARARFAVNGDDESDEDQPVLEGDDDAGSTPQTPADSKSRVLVGTYPIVGATTSSRGKGWIEHIASSPMAPIFAAAAGPTIHVLSLTGRALVVFEPIDSTVTSLAFTFDGALCAQAMGTVRVWQSDMPRRGVVTFSETPQLYEWKVSCSLSLLPWARAPDVALVRRCPGSPRSRHRRAARGSPRAAATGNSKCGDGTEACTWLARGARPERRSAASRGTRPASTSRWRPACPWWFGTRSRRSARARPAARAISS